MPEAPVKARVIVCGAVIGEPAGTPAWGSWSKVVKQS
jgi:hypothetical protein